MTDDELIAALEDTTLPELRFDHTAHLRTAYLLLTRDGFAGAIARMSAALRRYAASKGKANRYHETITVAHLALVQQHIAMRGDAGGWPQFVRANPELFDRRLLQHYYRDETLRSDLARRTFVMPSLGA
jgi:hypothetical protein